MNLQEIEVEVDRRVGDRLIPYLLQTRFELADRAQSGTEYFVEMLLDDMIELSHWTTNEKNRMVLREDCYDFYFRLVDPETFTPKLKRKPSA